MTLFSKIMAGQIPCFKIYEDEHTFAFLDINPINLGHTLVVPKIEVDSFLDLPEPYYSKVFVNAKIIGKAIQKATNCVRVCTWIEGFAVPHMHYHVCPIFRENGEFWSKRGSPQAEEEMKNIQLKIVERLEEVA